MRGIIQYYVLYLICYKYLRYIMNFSMWLLLYIYIYISNTFRHYLNFWILSFRMSLLTPQLIWGWKECYRGSHRSSLRCKWSTMLRLFRSWSMVSLPAEKQLGVMSLTWSLWSERIQRMEQWPGSCSFCHLCWIVWWMSVKIGFLFDCYSMHYHRTWDL